MISFGFFYCEKVCLGAYFLFRSVIFIVIFEQKSMIRQLSTKAGGQHQLAIIRLTNI